MIAEKLIVLLDLKKKVHLEINTLGNTSSRREYLKVLVKFLKKNESELSNESKRRLKTNPLRILDSKDPKDIKIRECAPRIFEYLDKESKDFFEKTLDGLKKLKINFILNPFLVRGLDYYNHTTFEYITNDKKSQNAILAGGRYDGLVKSLGGNDIGGVGWAAGIERIVLNAKRFEEEKNLISFFATSEKFNTNLLNLINELKLVESISVNFISSGNLKKKFSKANKLNSKGCIILGEDIPRRLLQERLMDLGDSIVLAGTKVKAKVHIHSDDPHKVFTLCKEYGSIHGEKTDDMIKQQSDAHSAHSSTAIIVDSGCDLPEEVIDNMNIHVIPVRLNFGNTHYVDKVSLTSDEFWSELKINPNHPQTSQPSPGDFRRRLFQLIF